MSSAPVAESYERAVHLLRERIRNLKGSYYSLSCSDEQRLLADSQAAWERRSAESSPWPWSDTFSEPTAFFLATIGIVIFLYIVVWGLLRRCRDWLVYYRLCQRQLRMLVANNTDIQKDVAESVVREAVRRQCSMRCFYWAVLQAVGAVAIIMGLGSAHVLMDRALTHALRSWWEHLSNPFYRDPGIHEEGTSYAFDHHRGTNKGALGSLGLDELSSLPALYVWYYLGPAALGLATYLLHRGARIMQCPRSPNSGVPLLTRIREEEHDEHLVNRLSLVVQSSLAEASGGSLLASLPCYPGQLHAGAPSALGDVSNDSELPTDQAPKAAPEAS